MKSSTIIFSFLFTFLLVFSSCQKDDGSFRDGEQQGNIPDTFSQYFGNTINRDFLGTIVNKNNLPLQGVTITIGNETAQTDSNGVFIIKDAEVNKRFGYIKAEKAGYIHGSRSVVPSEGTNKVEIMLLEATPIATISSGTAETVSLSNGSSVSFDGNFIKEDGSNYEGSVNVIMHHLDPVDEDMPMQMPGMLYAENEDGAERMLQTLGMLAVELRGSGGEDLNLAEGSTSEIKIPVDASLMGIAPATIPLWYFDEANGYWKEEGEATLQGNMYVGSVSHFSFWNCDIPAEAITLCVAVTDESGNAINNLSVNITSLTFGTRGGNTNENGEVCGFVPSGETLELNIYVQYSCDTSLLYSEMIGPFNADSSISVIVPNHPVISFETIRGNFLNCDGNPVSNGYIQLTYGNQSYTEIVNEEGDFEFQFLSCSTNDAFGINGTDYDNLTETDHLNFFFTSPVTDIGTIMACNSVEEFVQYVIGDNITVIDFDNINATFTEIPNNIYPITHMLSINGSTNVDNINHNYNLKVWAHAPDFIGLYNTDDTSFIASSGVASIGILSINTLGEVGEYIDISFSGFHSSQNGVLPVHGTIHVLRDE
ncbi:hypothetical protein [Winogradskyella ouciana]|uniref:hypothetical protein n=1 Tax=Winogradskyella ouciana TaxID=2608631 RepID=UPI003D2DFADF